MSTTPAPGRIVHYRLSYDDALRINKRRDDYQKACIGNRGPAEDGHQAHVGNWANEGDYYPAIIIRVFGQPFLDTPNEVPEQPVNLKVLLDDYWATSRYEGDGNGQWTWPPRV